MDEPKKDEEKFLPNPLDTPEILTAQLEKPLLSTEEFIKTTPHHELKNVFGAMPDKVPEPKSAPRPAMPPAYTQPVVKVTRTVETPKIFESSAKSATRKESPVPPPTVESLAKTKPKLSIGKIFLWVFLVVLILIIGLYVWGGILKERGVSPTTETSSQ